MKPPPLTFDVLAAYLDERLEARAYNQVRGRDGRGDQNGIYRPSSREVSRLTLALEPWPGLESLVNRDQTDALFLHRPWSLSPEQEAALLEDGVGVLAYHLSFDEHFTLGFNPPLAAVLGMLPPLEILGSKYSAPQERGRSHAARSSRASRDGWHLAMTLAADLLDQRKG